MTPIFKYDPSTGCVVEQSSQKEPKEKDYYQEVKLAGGEETVMFHRDEYNADIRSYKGHIRSLRTIPVSNQKNGKE